MWNPNFGPPRFENVENTTLFDCVFLIGLPLNERLLGVSPFLRFFLSLIKYGSCAKS